MTNSERLKASKYYWIGSKRYAVEKSIDFEIQSKSNDSRVYGWVLEYFNSNINEGFWLNLNNKIYSSYDVAVESALKSNELKDLKWRIRPIYIMDDAMYREFTIDKILDDDSDKKKFQVKFWKLIYEVEINYGNGNKYKYPKGALLIQLENGGVTMLKNCVDPVDVGHRYQLYNNLIPDNKVIEVEINDEKWAYPHLLTELKKKIQIK